MSTSRSIPQKIEIITKIKLPDGQIIDSDLLSEEEKTAYIEFAIHLAAPALSKIINKKMLNPKLTEYQGQP